MDLWRVVQTGAPAWQFLAIGHEPAATRTLLQASRCLPRAPPRIAPSTALRLHYPVPTYLELNASRPKVVAQSEQLRHKETQESIADIKAKMKA